MYLTIISFYLTICRLSVKFETNESVGQTLLFLFPLGMLSNVLHIRWNGGARCLIITNNNLRFLIFRMIEIKLVFYISFYRHIISHFNLMSSLMLCMSYYSIIPSIIIAYLLSEGTEVKMNLQITYNLGVYKIFSMLLLTN